MKQDLILVIETLSDIFNIALSALIFYFGLRIAGCLRLTLQRNSLRLMIGAVVLFALKEIFAFTEKQFFTHSLIHLTQELFETGFIACLCASMYLIVKSNHAEIAPLQERSEMDRLTGLYNLQAFRDHASGRIDYAIERSLPLVFIMFDLDDFKLYNDRYGHEAGNSALRAVARVLQRSARENDLIGRYGGEEFVALLFTSRDTARVVAERIRASVEAECRPDQNPTLCQPITASVGVAELLPQISLDEIIEAADQELYRAKKAGKNRVSLREPE